MFGGVLWRLVVICGSYQWFVVIRGGLRWLAGVSGGLRLKGGLMAFVLKKQKTEINI